MTVHQGDTSETPYVGTGGSRSGPILARDPTRGRNFARRSPAIAAHQLEASEADLDIVDGDIVVRHTDATTVAAVAHTAYLSVGALPRDGTGLEILKRYKTDLPFIFSNACHMCTVEIDRRDRRRAAAALRGE